MLYPLFYLIIGHLTIYEVHLVNKDRRQVVWGPFKNRCKIECAKFSKQGWRWSHLRSHYDLIHSVMCTQPTGVVEESIDGFLILVSDFKWNVLIKGVFWPSCSSRVWFDMSVYEPS